MKKISFWSLLLLVIILVLSTSSVSAQVKPSVNIVLRSLEGREGRLSSDFTGTRGYLLASTSDLALTYGYKVLVSCPPGLKVQVTNGICNKETFLTSIQSYTSSIRIVNDDIATSSISYVIKAIKYDGKEYASSSATIVVPSVPTNSNPQIKLSVSNLKASQYTGTSSNVEFDLSLQTALPHKQWRLWNFCDADSLNRIIYEVVHDSNEAPASYTDSCYTGPTNANPDVEYDSTDSIVKLHYKIATKNIDQRFVIKASLADEFGRDLRQYGFGQVSLRLDQGLISDPSILNNSSSTDCFRFSTNLTSGSIGPDVIALQEYLIAKGFDLPFLRSGGSTKGNFDRETKDAVIAYQKSIGVEPTGYVGPLTRAYLNANSCIILGNVSVSNIAVTKNDPIKLNNNDLVYPVSFNFTLNNMKDAAIYIPKNVSNFIRLNEKDKPSDVKIDSIVTLPSIISGDSDKVVVIPAGSSRKFTINFVLKNSINDGSVLPKVVKIVGLSYSDSLNSQNYRVIENGLENLSVSIVMTSTTTPSVPSFIVLEPLGQVTFNFGSKIPVVWKADNINVDYYYALLENTALKDFGVVITPNLSPATTSASFVFNSNILNAFLANGGGLNEMQLKNGYYVRVIGMKRGIFWNSVAVNSKSGVFSVSTRESSRGITVSNTQARMNNPVISGNVAIAYPVNFIFTVNNYSNDPIYLSKDPKYVTHIEYNSQTPSDVRFNSISTPIGLISGDNNKSYIVPVGTSRSFNVSAVLRNYSGVTEQRIVKVIEIQYLTSADSRSYSIIREGLENLKVYPMMDGVATTTVATTTVATTTSPSTGTSTSSINSGKKLGSLVASNANARLGSAIYKNNEIYAYNFTMTVKLSNVGDGPVYIRNKNDGTDTYALINPSTASVKYVRDVSPALLSGDTNNALIIPAGSSRMVTYQGTITNFGAPSLIVYSITGIRYGTSTASLDNTLSVGLESMKINSTIGVSKAATPVATAVPVYTTSPAITTSPRPTSSVTPTPSLYNSPSPTPYYSPTPVPTSTYYPSSTPVPTTTYSPTPVPTVSTTPTPTISTNPSPTVTSTPTPSVTPAYSPTPTSTPTPSTSSSPRSSTSPSPSTSPISGDFGKISQASVWTSILDIIFGNN